MAATAVTAKSKVVGSLAYPVFLAFAGFGVVTVLMVFFVPKFESIFEKLKEKGEMPDITSLLLEVSHFIQNYWWLVIGGAAAALFAYRWWSRTPRGRLVVDRIKVRLPLFGPVFMGLALSRFCRILGTMLHNGIPLLKSLTIAKDSTGNKVLTERIDHLRNADGDAVMSLAVMGIFEVQGDKITGWRDYFDTAGNLAAAAELNA